MILYFSATGNNKYVAQELAKRLDDRAVSILDEIKDKNYRIHLGKDEDLGFVFPTYFYGLPTIVMSYLHKLKISSFDKNHYMYMVASYGTSPGATHRFAKEVLKGSGIELDAFYSIQMPDTWTPEFDLSDKWEVEEINDAEPAQIDKIALYIKRHQEGNFMNNRHSYLISRLSYAYYEKQARKTKHFHVEDSCIGCGLCEKKCPVKAIRMQDGKPVWVKEKCVMCAGCLHRCPKFAIQYENKTQHHGQYRHPGVRI